MNKEAGHGGPWGGLGLCPARAQERKRGLLPSRPTLRSYDTQCHPEMAWTKAMPWEAVQIQSP